MKLPVKLIERYEKEYNLSKRSIEKNLLEIGKKSAKELDGNAQFERRRKMLASVVVEDFDDAFERYVGNNDLLPINYLQIGQIKSKAVGRIHYMDNEEMRPAVATGFLISPDLVMTNHHVFSNPQNFSEPIIEFDYEYDIYGKEKTKIIFKLNPIKFFYASEDLDMAIIGIEEKDFTGTVEIEERGYLVLNERKGKIGIGDFACIIQHPEGKPKQISLRENKIESLDGNDFIVYTSDTTVGSSGSPVFNDQWQVVALHSAGVAKKNEDGFYIDINDKKILPENGKIDSSRLVWLNNRGSKVSSMINLLTTDPAVNTNRFILKLFDPTYSDNKNLINLSYPQINEKIKTNLPINVTNTESTVPQSVVININLGDKQPVSTSFAANQLSSLSFLPSFEKKFEDELDFSDCKGFNEYFLGEQIPIPTLSAEIKRKVAYFVSNPNLYVLKYHHYSTIQHAVRRMPLLTAINIFGGNRYHELTGRNDKWFRDNRLDYDVQLNDDFYKYSGFDKGHMCRREDAEWGSSKGFAEMAANLTCSYTNACPQVPALNRGKFGYSGKWGKLELEILENGVKAIDEDSKKICVFNGPVFNDDDPVFKSVQVPLHFWKIVVWKNPEGNFKTTAFLLHQDRLVSEIEFELMYDEIFKTSQCSVSYLEKLTGLQFLKIKEWDTFIPDQNENEKAWEGL